MWINVCICFLSRLQNKKTQKSWINHTSFLFFYFRQQYFSQVNQDSNFIALSIRIRWAFSACLKHFLEHSLKIWLYLLFVSFFCSEINPTGDLPNNWFHAQSYCKGQGLTIERDKSDQPYWTGLYRRLTPWINILGTYRFAFIYHKFVFNIILKSVQCFVFLSFQSTLQLYTFTSVTNLNLCALF